MLIARVDRENPDLAYLRETVRDPRSDKHDGNGGAPEEKGEDDSAAPEPEITVELLFTNSDLADDTIEHIEDTIIDAAAIWDDAILVGREVELEIAIGIGQASQNSPTTALPDFGEQIGETDDGKSLMRLTPQTKIQEDRAITGEMDPDYEPGKNVFHLGADASIRIVSPDAFDIPTAAEELGHILGFFAFRWDGDKVDGPWTISSIYEMYIQREDGEAYFLGPNALAANDGERVHLYEDGWLTNLDPAYHRGVMAQGSDDVVLSPVEVGILRDMGYEIHDHLLDI